jgi:hypothetical protein
VQHLDVLLLNAFYRHETHVRSAHGLADRFGIVGVVLVAFHIRLDKLGADQSGIMPQFDQFPCPIVRPGTGLQANQARRQVGEKGQHLASLELLAQYGFAISVNTVCLKNVFCNV